MSCAGFRFGQVSKKQNFIELSIKKISSVKKLGWTKRLNVDLFAKYYEVISLVNIIYFLVL